MPRGPKNRVLDRRHPHQSRGCVDETNPACVTGGPLPVWSEVGAHSLSFFDETIVGDGPSSVGDLHITTTFER